MTTISGLRYGACGSRFEAYTTTMYDDCLMEKRIEIVLGSEQPVKADAETPSSTVVVAIQNDSPLCQSCITIAGLVETYLSQVKSMVDIVCTALHIRETCQGVAAMLLGALKVGGEEHVCSMIGLCGGNGSLVDVSFILKPLTSKVESALGSLINITSDAKGLLGDSINQTSSGITNLIGGTKQIGENFKKTFSFFGRRKRSNVDKANANSGQEFDKVFEGELHSVGLLIFSK
uniref:MIF4G domain-containing protein n=1 Tax=Angiostrongylus cantonensis TaxID=6313 RepID=A0A0K0DRI5_ANGCA